VRVETIASLEDPRVADYRNLRDADLRTPGLFMAEGRFNVERLVECSGFEVRSLFMTPTARDAMARSLVRLGVDTPVYVAPQSLLDGVVGYAMHRGCLAVGVRPARRSLDDLLATLGDGPALLVLLEDVNNADNVGGVFRNAMAFGAVGVLLTPGCVDPLYRKSIRVSMGGSLQVPFASVDYGAAPLEKLRAAGFCVAALATDAAALSLGRWQPVPPAPERVVLALGTESEGLSEPARRSADVVLRIPMASGIDSLNVYTAAGIAMHHVAAVLRGALE
jgi:tRNA G18 (ribose-2'-O)-methylase SpoU